MGDDEPVTTGLRIVDDPRPTADRYPARMSVLRIVRPAGDLWADAVAARWIDRLAQLQTSRMCLATGSTPLPIYQRVARSPQAFSAASVLLLDEFGDLPPGEPASCDRVLRRHLVEPARPADYRPIRVDQTSVADLAAECTAVDSWIDAGPGGLLDLAVLGLGLNGHVGMNEPGAPVDGRTARVDLAPTTRDGAQRYFEGRADPTWGVTVGLADLLGAREVWVLATGRAKAAVVERALEGPVTPDLPASLLQHHPNCTWWLDESSAPAQMM